MLLPPSPANWVRFDDQEQNPLAHEVEISGYNPIAVFSPKESRNETFRACQLSIRLQIKDSDPRATDAWERTTNRVLKALQRRSPPVLSCWDAGRAQLVTDNPVDHSEMRWAILKPKDASSTYLASVTVPVPAPPGAANPLYWLLSWPDLQLGMMEAQGNTMGQDGSGIEALSTDDDSLPANSGRIYRLDLLCEHLARCKPLRLPFICAWR